MRILRKIYYVQVSLLYFMTKDFDFRNNNTLNSQKLLSYADTKLFPWFTSLEFGSYMSSSLQGARQYLLRQDPKTIPRSKIKYTLFQVAHYMLILAIGYFIFKRFFINSSDVHDIA